MPEIFQISIASAICIVWENGKIISAPVHKLF